MGYYGKMKKVVLEGALVIAMMAIMLAEAQDVPPSCASNLIPCSDYLNATTKPPASCCDPLKDAVDKQLACLCNLYNSPDLLNILKINVTQALRLPTLCSVPDNLCQGWNNTNTSSPNVPSSGSPKDNDSSSKNHAGTLASTGIFGGLLVWASLMLF